MDLRAPRLLLPTILNPAGVTSNVVSNGTDDPSTIRDFPMGAGLYVGQNTWLTQRRWQCVDPLH
jgi:hypothetical protein